MIRRRFGKPPSVGPGIALAVVVALAGIGGSGSVSRTTGAGPSSAGLSSAGLSSAGPSSAAPPSGVGLVPAPARLRIPLLGVDAPVVPVTVGSGDELGVPDDPQLIGWWQAGGAPGAPGAAGVLDGHVDTAVDGPGALFRLAALRPGDAISVETRAGTSSSFVVLAVRRYAKAALPPDVFTAGSGPRLVLITCGGRFDYSTRRYADNVVVVAGPPS